MHSGILVVFCGTIVLVNTFPLLYDYYNPNTGNIEEIEFGDHDYQNPEFELSPCSQSQDGEVKCFFANGAGGQLSETPEYSSLPNYALEIAERKLELGQNLVYEQNIGALENTEINDLLPINPTHNNYQYESSPMRIGTYIHGLVPQDTSVFYDNIYPPEGPLSFNRLARRTSSYDEFLAQLSHDAMMNNIVPTMSFLRTPGNQYPVPYSGGPARATFPQAIRGCGRPFLFGCSPIIYQGIIAHKRYPFEPQVSASNKESLQNHKVTPDKEKSPVDSNKKHYRAVSKDYFPDNWIQ